MKNLTRLIVVTLISATLFLPLGRVQAAGASIYLSPSSGSFQVGSVLDIAVVINTGGSAVNAIEASIAYPTDKLQVISPSVGKSFISVWTVPPKYSNVSGTISFSGGLPSPGINSSSAIVSTIRFRVKSSGSATISFGSSTKILANDGEGTNILTSKTPAILGLTIAPPNGPLVISSTHPDQNVWYNSRLASFSWESVKNASSYSYSADNSPKTIPPKESSTQKSDTTIELESDGIWYFHIRALANGVWGGTTHYLVRVDSAAPAKFTVTANKPRIDQYESGIISFLTTDAASGIDHYEVKIINTSANDSDQEVSLFHEEVSPYELPKLKNGKYQIVVRGYDNAGNYTDSSVELVVGSSAIGLFNAINGPTTLILIIVGLLLIMMIALLLRRKTTKPDENVYRNPQEGGATIIPTNSAPQ